MGSADFVLTAIWWLFLSSFITRMFVLLGIHIRLAKYKAPLLKADDSKFVSAIVCYYNEAKTITQSIKRLLAQSYDKLQYILVDDQSTDQSYALLQAGTGEIDVTIISNKKSSIGKKSALSNGILRSKYDWILVTDADCTMGTDWCASMSSFDSKYKIVLGYAPLEKGQSLISRFARYETWFTAVQYLSFALSGLPYMGVGRNMMYHKSIFDDAGGFSDHIDIASGDDDLLINVSATGENTTICLDPNSFVYSQPKETLKSFIRQKRRHISSSHRYRMIHKLILGLSSMSHIVFYITSIVLLIFPTVALFSLCLMLLYWIMAYLVYFKICKKLHSIDIWWLYPLYDSMMVVYYIIMIPFTFTKKQNIWT